MTSDPLTLSANPDDHALGVVFRDDGAGPRTHVLVLGVGAYPWSTLPDLTSPAVSADAMADWFLGYGPTRFANPGRPIGSLAILRSEPGSKGREGTPSAYRGVTVPRPTVANAARAATAWCRRLAERDDNMAVLYVCGHGFSEGLRSVFVLEDHGCEPGRPLRGLIDAGNLSAALATYAVPAQVIAFDCCRSASPPVVQPGTPFSDYLVDHAGPRAPSVEQLALFATMLDAAAAGRRNATSLFTASLLTALDVGASRKGPRWVVRPGSLFDTLADCLALYGHSADAIQRPEAALSATRFIINCPEFRDEVRTFVALADREKWPDARITVSRVGETRPAPLLVIDGSRTAEPFFEAALPVGQTFSFSADLSGTTYEVRTDVAAPALFVSLPDELAHVVSVPLPSAGGGTAAAADRGGPGPAARYEAGRRRGFDVAGAAEEGVPEAMIEVLVEQAYPTEGTIIRVEGEADDASVGHPAPAHGSALVFRRPPGHHRVTAAFPDGRRVQRIVRAAAGETARITVAAGQPPRPYLAAAAAAGLVTAGGEVGIPALLGGEIRASPVKALTFAALAVPMEDGTGPAFVLSHDDVRDGCDGQPPRYALLEVRDPAEVRFPPGAAGALPWAVVAVGDRETACVVPSVGSRPGWVPQIVVDRFWRPGRSAAAPVVASPVFTGLAGHVARQDIERAALVLQSLQRRPRGSRGERHERDNPVLLSIEAIVHAASADHGGAVADRRAEAHAQLHPGIPDLAVVLARRRWMRATGRADRDAALALFRRAFDLGVPAFTIALRWLAEGLVALEGADAATARAAGAVAARAHGTRCFTSLDLADRGRGEGGA